MTRKLSALILTLILVLVAVYASAEISLIDMANREIVLEQPAERVVVLAAADCEILCAIGAENTLVGRGAYCDYPASILSVPAVDSGYEMNMESILALSPQVVIMPVMYQSIEQVQALENAGITVVVSDAQNIEGVYEAIRMIGTVTDKCPQADALIEEMQSCFASINAQESGKTVYFEVSPLEWGLWTAGANTFMNEIADLCGLTNAFADVNGWASVSEEQVLARDPDYIVTITMYYGEGPTPDEEIKSRAGWENLKALQNNAVFCAQSDPMSRPGPRLMEAALALNAFVNAE